MCGIIIIKSKKIDKVIYSKFKKSLNYLKNRGPDETKVFRNKNLLVGFTRLSINDIKSGSQPFLSSCKNYLIAFNGEIVNYKSLKEYLKNKKIKLRYGHEAEVILNLYKMYGKNCVNFLRGFFSFAVIELNSNKIFAAVDRFGIKPMYYHNDKSRQITILTSDFSVLLKSKIVKEKINFDKVIDFMTLAREFDNKTFYKDINRLNAASFLKINNKSIISNIYWRPFNNSEIKKKGGYLIKKLNENFLEILKLWKISELKTSLCLSNGLDSNLLNLYLKRDKKKCYKFHIIEDDKRNDKNLIQFNADLKKVDRLITKFLDYTKNPFPLAHASCTSLFQLYNDISKKKFKFTLNGEGSDEIFGGYLRYNKQLKYLKKNPNFSNCMIKTYNKNIVNMKRVMKHKINLEYLLTKKIRKIKLKSKSKENKILEFDQLTWIPSLIQRHDAIGMFFGLEVRPPFLDHKLAEFVNSIPGNEKFSESNNKILLKKLLNKEFSYSDYSPKIPTPTQFKEIIFDIIGYKKFKKNLFKSKISKIFDKVKLANMLKNPNTDITFLWRIYILSKIY